MRSPENRRGRLRTRSRSENLLGKTCKAIRDPRTPSGSGTRASSGSATGLRESRPAPSNASSYGRCCQERLRQQLAGRDRSGNRPRGGKIARNLIRAERKYDASARSLGLINCCFRAAQRLHKTVHCLDRHVNGAGVALLCLKSAPSRTARMSGDACGTLVVPDAAGDATPSSFARSFTRRT